MSLGSFSSGPASTQMAARVCLRLAAGFCASAEILLDHGAPDLALASVADAVERLSFARHRLALCAGFEPASINAGCSGLHHAQSSPDAGSPFPDLTL